MYSFNSRRRKVVLFFSFSVIFLIAIGYAQSQTVPAQSLLLDYLKKTGHISTSGNMEGRYHFIHYATNLSDEEMQSKIHSLQQKLEEKVKDFPRTAKDQADMITRDASKMIQKKNERREEDYRFKMKFSGSSYVIVKKSSSLNAASLAYSTTTSYDYDEIDVFNNEKFVNFKTLVPEIKQGVAKVYAKDMGLDMELEPRFIGSLPENLYKAIFEEKKLNLQKAEIENYEGHSVYALIFVPAHWEITNVQPMIKILIDPEHQNRVVSIQALVTINNKVFPSQIMAFSRFVPDISEGTEYPQHAEHIRFNVDTTTLVVSTTSLITMDITKCNLGINIPESEFQAPVFPKNTLVVDYRFKVPFQYHEKDPPLSEQEVAKLAVDFIKETKNLQLRGWSAYWYVMKGWFLFISICTVIYLLYTGLNRLRRKNT